MPITIGQRQNDQGQNLGTGITQVDFIFNNNDYLSLIGMNSWTPNVGLSIITGVNGGLCCMNRNLDAITHFYKN